MTRGTAAQGGNLLIQPVLLPAFLWRSGASRDKRGPEGHARSWAGSARVSSVTDEASPSSFSGSDGG